VLNAYFPLGHNPGGFRVWWRRLPDGSDEQLDNTHLMRFAGRFARRVKAWANANDVPLIYYRTPPAAPWCPACSEGSGVSRSCLGLVSMSNLTGIASSFPKAWCTPNPPGMVQEPAGSVAASAILGGLSPHRVSGVIQDGHEGDALAGHEGAGEKAPPVGSAGPLHRRRQAAMETVLNPSRPSRGHSHTTISGAKRRAVPVTWGRYVEALAVGHDDQRLRP